MTEIIHLVDSLEYVEANCYQHQLLSALRSVAQVETRSIRTLGQVKGKPVVCCLKQRTLHRELSLISSQLGDAPIVIYDQDPHHAYMDESPYKGIYEQASSRLNVKAFAVTSDIWAKFIASKGLPSRFIRMWMLQQYCDRGPSYEDRLIKQGFIGTVHPYRQKMFDSLRKAGYDVHLGNSLPYADYLTALSRIRTFVHSEDITVKVEGKDFNLGAGPWIKDIEAASRGCFAIRNRCEGSETYLADVKTVHLYDDLSQVPDILCYIEKMDAAERQANIDEAVQNIRMADVWHQTAYTLVQAVTE